MILFIGTLLAVVLTAAFIWALSPQAQEWLDGHRTAKNRLGDAFAWMVLSILLVIAATGLVILAKIIGIHFADAPRWLRVVWGGLLGFLLGRFVWAFIQTHLAKKKRDRRGRRVF